MKFSNVWLLSSLINLVCMAASVNELIPQKDTFLRLPDEATVNVGRYTNVKIGLDGMPIIAFNDENYRGIHVVHLNDLKGDDRSTILIDPQPGSNGDNGRFIRMEINPKTNLPYFTYLSSSQSTMIAWCQDVLCKDYGLKELYTGRSSHPSLAFYPSGQPVAAYRTQDGIEIALCEDLSCSTFSTKKIIDENGICQKGDYVHIEVGLDNIPALSFESFDAKSGPHAVTYARCSDSRCSAFSITIVDKSSNNLGRYNFFRLDSNGNAVILYTDVENGFLKIAYCEDSFCSTKKITIIDDNIGAKELVHGVFPELDINPKNALPIISYVAQPNAADGSPQGILKVAQCRNRDCSDFIVHEIARGGLGFGRDTSMAFKGNLIYLTFLDYNNDNKLAFLTVLEQWTE